MAAILIVDDSLTVRADLAAALEAAGFSTLQCETVAEARIALRSHPIALAILDVQLPDGDGVELLTTIRKDFLLRELPVLMLSTEPEVCARISGLARGADGFIGKPYDPDDVIARVRRLLGAPAVRDLVLIIDGSSEFAVQLAGALDGAGLATSTAAGGAGGPANGRRCGRPRSSSTA
jgi:DNA-binding response OmpR family regulator